MGTSNTAEMNQQDKHTRVAYFFAFASIFFVTLLFDHWILTLIFKLVISYSIFYVFCKIYERRRKIKYVSSPGKCVFVTGCDTGFGNEIARKLDELGLTVFAGCLFSEKDEALKLKRECSSSLHIVQLDVTVDQSIRNALAYVKENLNGKHLHAIVNNAGIALLAPSEWIDTNDFRKVLEVNTLGVQNVSQHFLPLLRESKGRIVNVISVAARFHMPLTASYSMSKAATKAYNDILRKELKPFGINVISIEPKLYRTPMSEASAVLRNIDALYNNPKKPDIKQVYGDKYCNNVKKRYNRTFENQASVKTGEVCVAVVNAVLDAAPRYHYEPSATDWIAKVIIQFMPDMVFDYLLSLLDNVPPVYCEQNNKN